MWSRFNAASSDAASSNAASSSASGSSAALVLMRPSSNAARSNTYYHLEFELENSLECRLAEKANRLSFRNIRSLEVFTNPLLMGMIFEKIHYFDILRLRGVSRGIRRCIDDLKPDPHIVSYKINLEYFHRSTMYHSGAFSRYMKNRIFLRGGERKCIKSPNRTSQYDGDIRDSCVEAANHFKTHTMHQKSRMDEFSLLSVGNVAKLIGDVLKSRDTPLRVRRLVMTQAKEKDIMNILPYLDSVESIFYFSIFEYKSVNLAEVSKLFQWRNALELDFRNCMITNTIEELNLINFKTVDIKIKSFSSRDVIYLKQNIPKSFNFNEFKIKFKYSLIEKSFYTSLPPFKREPYIESIWFFPMLNSNDFLHIQLYEQRKQIILKRVDREDVPVELL